MFGGGGGVGPTRGRPPDQDTGLRLLEPPPFGLFAPMVVPAERSEVAFAGEPALTPGDRMIQVAASRGLAAARRGAGRAPGADQVGQLAAGEVAGLGMGVVAGTAGDREQRAGEPEQVACGQGVRRAGARREAAAGQAGVGGGGAVGIQGGNTPPGAGVAGRGGGQVAGVVGVQRAEPVRFAGGLGPALQGSQRDGNGDQRREARPGGRFGSGGGARTTRTAGAIAGAASAGAAGPVRVAASLCAACRSSPNVWPGAAPARILSALAASWSLRTLVSSAMIRT